MIIEIIENLVTDQDSIMKKMEIEIIIEILKTEIITIIETSMVINHNLIEIIQDLITETIIKMVEITDLITEIVKMESLEIIM